MWIAWDDDGLIVSNDDNLNNKITFNTKKDAVWDISCRYMDPRKRLQVNRICQGYYIYYPKNCDGEYGNETIIVNIEYLKSSELKETFIELLNVLIKDLETEKHNSESMDIEFSETNFLNELKNFKKSF